jgi:membrane protease YdiL (CAAX protease family)
MDNNRTAIIILGVLGLAFVVAIFQRLQQPIPQQLAESSTGGMVAALISGGVLIAMWAAWVFNRDKDRTTRFRNLAIWGAIIIVLALVLASFGSGSGPSTGNTV